MKLRQFAFPITLLGLASGVASAQINQWTGTTSGVWNLATNWSNNSIPNGSGTDEIFNSAGLNRAMTLTADTTTRGLFLYGGDYSLSPTAAETLTLQGGGFTQLGSGTFTLNTNVLGVAGNDLTFNGNGTGAITINGAINNVDRRWDMFNESGVNLTNAYTSNSASATALRIRSGALTLSGANGAINQATAGARIVIGAASYFGPGVVQNLTGSALVLDNTGTNVTNRITDTNQIDTSVRSLIDFKGNAAAASSETLGIFNVSGPGSRIRVSNGGGQSSQLTFASLQVNNAVGNTGDTNGNPTVLQFLVPTGSTLGAAGASGSRVLFTTPPALNNGVLRYGVIKDESSGGATFATYDTTVDNGAALGVKALAAYTTTDIEDSTATSNVDISGNAAISAIRTANAIRITPTASGQALELSDFALRLSNTGGASGLIFNGGFDYLINNTSGIGVTQNGVASYLYINSNTLTINAPYVKGSEMTKAGDGALVINGEFNNGSARQLGVDDGSAADDMTINGAISGLNLTKNGLGTLVLGGSGDNIGLSAGVSINSGTIVLDKSSGTLQDNALGSGTLSLNGGTLVARNTAVTLANTVNIAQQGGASAATQITGNQAITFSGLVQGALNSGQNYIIANNSSAGLTLSGTVQGFNANNAGSVNSALEFSGSGTTTITGVIRNTDPTFVNAATMTTGLNKTGSGLLILQGANTYTGFLPSGSTASTAILGGYLRADAANTLGTGHLLISEANYSAGLNAVLELGIGNTTFSRTLATSGLGNVQLGSSSGNALNNGGFAAVTGTALVQLNGGIAAVTYGTPGFFGSGGNLTLGSPNVAGTVDFQNAINLAGGSGSNVTRTINTLNGSAAVDAIISGVIANTSGTGTNNGIRKTGAGALSLTNANTYTGATTVLAGTLLANNVSGSGTGTGAVTVASGATLGGTGTITGAITAPGIIAPGNGIGTLTANGGVTLSGSLSAEVNATTADSLVVTGDLNLTGAVLNLTALATPTAPSLILASYTGTLTSTFGSVTGLPGGYTVVYDAGLKQIRLESGVVLTPVESWFASFGLPTNTGLNLDGDNDGIQNLLEFVLGGNPTTNDSPSIRPAVTAAGTALVVTFNRSDASELSPLPTAVKVQVSSNLVVWSPADDITIGPISGTGPNGATYTVTENGAAADTIVVTIPKAAALVKFARVVGTR